MAVAKIIEIISGSKDGFDDAVRKGIARASETVEGIEAAWVKDESVVVDGGKVTEYRVTLKITFMLKDGS
jgi:flavin-binding protein dodecin